MYEFGGRVLRYEKNIVVDMLQSKQLICNYKDSSWQVVTFSCWMCTLCSFRDY